MYQTGECRDCEALNANLRARIEALTSDKFIYRNHLLGDRYENLYVAIETLPEVRVILDLATARAAHILHRPKKYFRLGWWLNIMQPGETTLPHTHDDAEELLSGVYYISVPPNSGTLLLSNDMQHFDVEPREGQFVFFAPHISHQVTRNMADRARISVGFNLGPA